MSNIVFYPILITIILTSIAIYTGTKDSFIIKQTIAGLFILFAILLRKHWLFMSGKLKYFILFYLCSIIISLINATHKGLVFDTLFYQLIFSSMYFFALELTNTQKEIIFKSILYICILITIYGLFQYLGIDFINWKSDYGRRPHSSFGNPNFYAGYIVLIIPLTIMKFIESKNFNKYLWLFTSIMLIINLIMNKTRGAWIAFICSIIFLLLIYLRKMRIIKQIHFYILIAVIFIVLFSGSFIILKDYYDKTNPSVIERLFKWQTAFEMIKKYPITGIGAGNLKVNYALYQSQVKQKFKISLKGTSESNVHNEYLQIFAETGLLGLLSFISIFISYFFYFFKYLNSNNHELQYSSIINCGIASGIIAFLIYSLSNFPLHITPTAITMFLFLGLSEAKENSNIKEEFSISNLKYKNIIFIFGSIIYIILIWNFVIKQFIADIYRKKAEVDFLKGNIIKSINEYEIAIKLDYNHSERTAYDLGELYRNLGDFDNAIRAYKISVDLRNYAEVYNCIGNCYWLKNQVKDAIDNWQKAIELGLPNPSDQESVKKNIQYAKSKL